MANFSALPPVPQYSPGMLANANKHQIRPRVFTVFAAKSDIEQMSEMWRQRGHRVYWMEQGKTKRMATSLRDGNALIVKDLG
ncbi:uncharacterized protein LOC120180539 isoform X2 [Hibiscus syriacus]|uniref:uncharacterized protein LOC120180539 isoform X2 n=1 Tax=Hibiscus syriacus TaxID=106335 RepID=UPI00192285D6|nr:uncharacterized protein LOC120180539 isoform X2 [Hibiscus syriacus]